MGVPYGTRFWHSRVESITLPGAMIVRVKICGVTRPADAAAAIEAGADALGFMFFPPSPRHITPAQAAALTHGLPPFVTKVGVFVNPTDDDVRRAIETVGLDAL